MNLKTKKTSFKTILVSLFLMPTLVTGVASAGDHKEDKKKMNLRELRKAFQERFDKMDTDQDGKISRAEFEATLPKFDNIDTDGSNALSKAELRSYLKSVRDQRNAEKAKKEKE